MTLLLLLQPFPLSPPHLQWPFISGPKNQKGKRERRGGNSPTQLNWAEEKDFDFHLVQRWSNLGFSFLGQRPRLTKYFFSFFGAGQKG